MHQDHSSLEKEESLSWCSWGFDQSRHTFSDPVVFLNLVFLLVVWICRLFLLDEESSSWRSWGFNLYSSTLSSSSWHVFSLFFYQTLIFFKVKLILGLSFISCFGNSSYLSSTLGNPLLLPFFFRSKRCCIVGNVNITFMSPSFSVGSLLEDMNY